MAGKIPQSFIDQLIDRSDIVEVIDARIRLKKTGTNYSALCPFHQEKTPSFSVNPDKQFYYCFGCGSGGNVISFLMDYERTSFTDTVENLARMSGMTVPYERQTRQQAKAEQVRRNVYDLLQSVSDYYQQQLREHLDKNKAINYLKGRGLSGEICKQFGIGFAPPGWDNALKAFGQQAEGLALLREAGMLVERDNGTGFYDRFRDRLMFPIIDNRGRVIAFGGRVFNDDKPKYLNSPETTVFHKQNELYGLWQARQANRHLQRLIMVEGYMDVVALAQFDITCAVATLGTAAGEKHMEKAFRHTSEIVFCFDGDEAGRKAANRALDAALPLMQDGRQIRFLFMPEGEDPDSWVRTIGRDQFFWHIEKAQSLSERLFDLCGEGLNLQSVDDKSVLVSRIRPYLQRLPEGSFRLLLLQALSDRTGLALSVIEQLFSQAQSRPSEPESHYASVEPYEDEAYYQQEPWPEFVDGEQAPVQRQQLSAEDRRVVRTSARVAAVLLLFYPHFALEQQALLEKIQLDKNGCDLLGDLYRYIVAHPETQSASMMAYWLLEDNRRISSLLRLALEYDDEKHLAQEFKDAIDNIIELQGKQQAQQTIEGFRQAQDPKSLSEDERAAFARLFQRE